MLPSDFAVHLMMAKTSWSVAYQFGRPEPKYAPRGAKQAVSDLDAFAASEATDQQHVFVKKYRAELDGTIGSLGLVGSELGEFLYMEGEAPVMFAWKGDDLTVVVNSLASTNIYNTLQLDVNKRAVTALRGMILPSLKAFDAFKNTSDVKYYGIVVVYGSKNFLDKDVLATKAESLMFVVRADQCRKFVGGELTEDELVAGADIYIADRDMVTGIKKIRLTIQ